MKQHTKTIRTFAAGAATALLAVSLISPATAALRSKNIQVFTGLSILIDGMTLTPTDANGNEVEVFAYNGTTYVPLRAVSQSLGKAVNYDSANQTVYIGETPGMKQYLLKVCPPYQTNQWFETPPTVTMAGQKYTNGCIIGDALFNLNGQYNTLSFDIGHRDGVSTDSSTFNIYLDSELVFTIDLTGEMMPKHFDVPLNKALQMKFEGTSYCTRYALANITVN